MNCNWFRNFSVLIKWTPMNSLMCGWNGCFLGPYLCSAFERDRFYDDRWCLRYNLFFCFVFSGLKERQRENAATPRSTSKIGPNQKSMIVHTQAHIHWPIFLNFKNQIKSNQVNDCSTFEMISHILTVRYTFFSLFFERKKSKLWWK